MLSQISNIFNTLKALDIYQAYPNKKQSKKKKKNPLPPHRMWETPFPSHAQMCLVFPPSSNLNLSNLLLCFIFLGVKMESWDWELEELFDLEMVFLIQFFQSRTPTHIFFLKWLMQYQQRAYFMCSTVQGNLYCILKEGKSWWWHFFF